MVSRSTPLLVVAFLSTTSSAAHADGADPHALSLPDRSYLWDGGAVPYLYLPLALTIGLRTSTSPRARPLLFDRDEGGERYSGGQYPVAMLYVDAAVAGGVILLGGDDSRWLHLKGLTQGLAVTQLLTTVAKNAFGRHRPHYDLSPGADNPPDRRRSFWSGHSSSTLATATYLGLYARQHVFSRWREPGTLPWWEGLTYVGLTSAALAVPFSQYKLRRHHASDVIVGGLVGAGTAALFYAHQERRFRRSRSGRDESLELVLAPDPSINGFVISGTW